MKKLSKRCGLALWGEGCLHSGTGSLPATRHGMGYPEMTLCRSRETGREIFGLAQARPASIGSASLQSLPTPHGMAFPATLSWPPMKIFTATYGLGLPIMD